MGPPASKGRLTVIVDYYFDNQKLNAYNIIITDS
jgi:hypothetical protein